MTREEKIHWIENKVFESTGSIEINTPVAYECGKGDIAEILTLFMGEPLMVKLSMSNTSIPIDQVDDDGVDNLFRVVCS